MQFVCQFCNRHFENRKHHCLHLMREHKAYVFCAYCEKQFVWKTDASHHELKVHILRKYFYCTNCWMIFSSKNTLSTHKNKCYGSIFCRKCKKSAPDHECLSAHLEFEELNSPSCHRGSSSSPPLQRSNADESKRDEQVQCKNVRSNQLIRLKIVNVNAQKPSRIRENSPPVPKRPRSSGESFATRISDGFTHANLVEDREDKFDAYPLSGTRKSIEILNDDSVQNDKESTCLKNFSPKIKEEIDPPTDSSNDSIVQLCQNGCDLSSSRTSTPERLSILDSAECLSAQQEIDNNNSNSNDYFCSLCNFAENDLISMKNHMDQYHKLPAHLRIMFCVSKNAQKLSFECEHCSSKQKQIDRFKFLLKNLMDTANDMRDLL